MAQQQFLYSQSNLLAMISLINVQMAKDQNDLIKKKFASLTSLNKNQVGMCGYGTHSSIRRNHKKFRELIKYCLVTVIYIYRGSTYYSDKNLTETRIYIQIK